MVTGRLAAKAAMLAAAMALHGVANGQIYVDDDAPPGGDGTSWQTAFNDLQVALTAWQATDQLEIRIAEGLYITQTSGCCQKDGFRSTGPVLESGNAFATAFIRGGFAGLSQPSNPDAHDPSAFVTVLSGDFNQDDHTTEDKSDNAWVVLNLNMPWIESLHLEGLTIRDGYNFIDLNRPNGAAVFCRTTRFLYFRSCTVTQNAARFGSVVYAPDATQVSFLFSRITDNSGAYGTVIHRGDEQSVGFTNSIVARNHAIYDGGVVYASSLSTPFSSVGLLHSVLVDNTAGRNGGAVYLNNGRLVMRSCTIANNVANVGGVVYADHESAIYLQQSVVGLNRAPIGASVFMPGIGYARFVLQDSILENWEHDLLLGPTVDTEIVNTLEADPAFRSPNGPDGIPASGDEDYRVFGRSPAIDRSDYLNFDYWDLNNNGIQQEDWPFDVAGQPRRVNGQVDLGAYEYQCLADISGSSDPNDAAYGRADGLIDGTDFFTFLDRFAAGNVLADLSGSSDPVDPGYGVPDGAFTAADFFYYLDRFVEGCE